MGKAVMAALAVLAWWACLAAQAAPLRLPADKGLVAQGGSVTAAARGALIRYRGWLLAVDGAVSEERPDVVLTSADARLQLQLYTTQPALQLCSGQYLAGLPAPDGLVYRAYQGLALEPQWLPDSPNHPEWPQPSVWLLPGQVWHHRAVYRFLALH